MLKNLQEIVKKGLRKNMELYELKKEYHKELEIKKFLSDSKRKEFFITKGKIEALEFVLKSIKKEIKVLRKEGNKLFGKEGNDNRIDQCLFFEKIIRGD